MCIKCPVSTFVLAVCLTTVLSGSAAAGPSWVDELSSQDAWDQQPDKADSMDIWIPAGTYATVGVYDTQTIEVQAPEAVQTDIYRIRYIERTVFKLGHGFSKKYQAGEEVLDFTKETLAGQERTAMIPWFLPSPKWYKPNGPNDPSAWALRMFCDQVGDYTVPIKCDQMTVTVTVHVTEPVPASDCGFGFYNNYMQNPRQDKDPKMERLYFQQMREYGCNTVTIYARGTEKGEDLLRQLDNGIETGLLDKRFPVLVLAGFSFSNEGRQFVADARKKGKHTANWPELIGYGPDEPVPEVEERVKQACQEIHDAGLRAATAIGPASAFRYGHLLDIWIVPTREQSRVLRDKAERDGVEWWVYSTTFRGSNAAMNRYLTGAWAWKVRPRVIIPWVYMQYPALQVEDNGNWRLTFASEVDGEILMWHRALATPNGPMATVGLTGYRDGTVDYRILRELERLITEHPRHKKVAEIADWLQRIDDKVEMKIYFRSFDESDTRVPPIDCAAMRRQAIAYIEELKGL